MNGYVTAPSLCRRPLLLELIVYYDHQATSTGQLNTILTFYEITDPPVPSPLSDMPLPLLRSAIGVLAKTARAQTIAIPDGEGVRFLAGRGT
jgi:ESCRT-II complex subunit VPS25